MPLYNQEKLPTFAPELKKIEYEGFEYHQQHQAFRRT